MAIVAGVDGCKAGWVAVVLRDGRFERARLARTFRELLDAEPEVAAWGVDIPIGLTDGAPREADTFARTFVAPLRSSVFPTPPRAVVEAKSYPDAARLCTELTGRGLSRQSFGLSVKILEVDAFRDDPSIYEVHPEVSFRALAGEPLRERKKSWAGQARRLELLAGAGIVLPADLGEAARATPPDDVIDAAAAAWSANRIANGAASHLPDTLSQRDGDRPIAIWY